MYVMCKEVLYLVIGVLTVRDLVRSKSFTDVKDVTLAIKFTMYMNVHTVGVL